MSTAINKTKKPLYKRVWVWALAILALFVLIGILGSSPEDDEAPALAESPTTAAATEPAAPTTTPASEVSAEVGAEVGSATEDEPTTEAAPEPTTEDESEVEEPEMTTAQSGAVRSATSYVDLMGFSRQGLIDQLTSEYGDGYDLADAEFAVSHLESAGLVDWNEEAVQSAESYVDLMGFSRQGLIDQLTSEYGDKYTLSQAEHAADAVGL